MSKLKGLNSITQRMNNELNKTCKDFYNELIENNERYDSYMLLLKHPDHILENYKKCFVNNLKVARLEIFTKFLSNIHKIVNDRAYDLFHSCPNPMDEINKTEDNNEKNVLTVYEDDGSDVVHKVPITDDGKAMDWKDIELIG